MIRYHSTGYAACWEPPGHRRHSCPGGMHRKGFAQKIIVGAYYLGQNAGCADSTQEGKAGTDLEPWKTTRKTQALRAGTLSTS